MDRLTDVGRAAMRSAAHRSAEERRRVLESADVDPDADQPEDRKDHEDGDGEPEPVGSVHDGIFTLAVKPVMTERHNP